MHKNICVRLTAGKLCNKKNNNTTHYINVTLSDTKKRRFHMLFKSVLMMFANNSECISYLVLDILSNKGRCSERLSMPIYYN